MKAEKSANKESKSLLDEVSNLAERRGFFFKSCEVYSDANSGFFEYGPNGVALKNNLITSWRKHFIEGDEMIEIDGSQIMSKHVFEASGHLTSLGDPLVQCEKCKFISRADKLIEEKTDKSTPEKLKLEEYDSIINKSKISCPKCNGKLSKTRFWNLMFDLGIGPERNPAYLRPETCQSIFVDFPRLFSTCRIKLPIGVAQVGKSFRNEISPRQSLLRSREFTQAEIEVFFNPKKTSSKKFDKLKSTKLLLMHDGKSIKEISVKDSRSKRIVSSDLIAYYLSLLQNFYTNLGIPKQRIRFRKLSDEEKPFYSSDSWDLEVETSLGWIELVACNNRGDYDLSSHARKSGKNFQVMDENEKVLPNIFELSMGIDRTLYVLMDLFFKKEKVKDEERIVLQLPSRVSPIQVAVFPLVGKDGLPEIANKIYEILKENFRSSYDESGSIGKMYRRQDEIGTPICITIDYDTKKDKSVTVRNRDTMKQKRVKIKDLEKELNKILK